MEVPISPKRRLDELNHGTPASLARRAISRASSSVAASGLSMNSGLCAAITGRACSRCTRPSTLSSSTPSTFVEQRGDVGHDLHAPLRVQLLGELVHAPRCSPGYPAAALEGRHHARAGDVVRLRRVVVEHFGERRHVRGVGADDPQAEVRARGRKARPAATSSIGLT